MFKKVLKYVVISICWFVVTSLAIGAGVTSINSYLPGVLNPVNVWTFILGIFLIGLPFSITIASIYYLFVIFRNYKETDVVERKSFRNRRLEKRIKKLEKAFKEEGITILW